jgi:lipoic acid synthetase
MACFLCAVTEQISRNACVALPSLDARPHNRKHIAANYKLQRRWCRSQRNERNGTRLFREVAERRIVLNLAQMATPFIILSNNVTPPPSAHPRPSWLRVKYFGGPNYQELKRIMRTLDLHTVCESARCPNMGECWEHRTATFMILGNICTRACGFCAVPSGKPLGPPEGDEPERVAEAVEQMGLRYAVVTSVNRDDQADGGAEIFARTITKIRVRVPGCRVEVLIPDFRGDWQALETVLAARPDVLNHNMETVPRLYRAVRKGAVYERSLELLRRAGQMLPGIAIKTGMMLGLGETRDELLQAMQEIAAQGTHILTLGQYLQPTPEHLPIERYVRPDEFAEYKRLGEAMGLKHVEAGPLVRSSYHAFEQEEAARG